MRMPAYAAAIDPAPRLARGSARSSIVLPRGWKTEAMLRFDEFDSEPEQMPFTVDVVGASRLFVHSSILFEPGEHLFVSLPLPGGHCLDARAQVLDCEFEGARSGMQVRLDELSHPA